MTLAQHNAQGTEDTGKMTQPPYHSAANLCTSRAAHQAALLMLSLQLIAYMIIEPCKLQQDLLPDHTVAASAASAAARSHAMPSAEHMCSCMVSPGSSWPLPQTPWESPRKLVCRAVEAAADLTNP